MVSLAFGDTDGDPEPWVKPIRINQNTEDNYYQFHEKFGQSVENSQFAGTVHTDSPIRRIGYFGLTHSLSGQSV